MLEAAWHHWAEYLMEAALLGGFMISACFFGFLLEHPASAVRQRLRHPFVRRVLMGLAMGFTAVALIYSPWGEQSGAHMNPATTLTFLWLGKISGWDAWFYILSQMVGGVLGVAAVRLLLPGRLGHPDVNFVATVPGRRGVRIAWLGELAISFLMMLAVLVSSNSLEYAPATGVIAGVLLALYIAFEAPLSGMSLNPARTLGSAVAARQWQAFWVYVSAPVMGMWLAAAVYSAWPSHPRVYCAKLAHCNDQPCIFHCEFGELQAKRKAGGSTVVSHRP